MQTTRQRRRLAAALAPALAVALAVTGAASHSDSASAAAAGAVKVMPLGDSITDGNQTPGGYRIGLCQRLTTAGYAVQFVGSLSNGPAEACSTNNEGHSGWRIDQLDANIVGWLNAAQPHTVLLHIGTNDITQNYDLSNAPNRLSALIDHITNTLPNAEVFVAQIIPMSFDTAQENAFNAAIPGIVANKDAAGKHVHLVDMFDALTTADLADGVHPTAAGYDKMAAAWYRALLSVPGSVGDSGQPSASPSPSASASASPSPSASGGGVGSCKVSDSISAWNTGLTENITITNTAASTVNGWKLAFVLAPGQSITNTWNATISPSSGTVSATSLSYNATIAPGATASFGFQADHTGNASPPTAFSLNGTTCTSG
jgi:lysophospholipase L1-like esterase